MQFTGSGVPVVSEGEQYRQHMRLQRTQGGCVMSNKKGNARHLLSVMMEAATSIDIVAAFNDFSFYKKPVLEAMAREGQAKLRVVFHDVASATEASIDPDFKPFIDAGRAEFFVYAAKAHLSDLLIVETPIGMHQRFEGGAPDGPLSEIGLARFRVKPEDDKMAEFFVRLKAASCPVLAI